MSSRQDSQLHTSTICPVDELATSQFPDATQDSLTLSLHRDVSYQWCRLSDCPGECSKHTVVHYHNALYLFGGDDGARSMLNQLLIYNIANDTWTRPVSRGSPPAARYHHSAVVAGDKMLVFGGYTGDLTPNLSNRNDLFEYHFRRNEWREWHFDSSSPMPVPRSAHGVAVHDDKLWIFGGYDGNRRLNDMWYVKLGSLQASSCSPASPSNSACPTDKVSSSDLGTGGQCPWGHAFHASPSSACWPGCAGWSEAYPNVSLQAYHNLGLQTQQQVSSSEPSSVSVSRRLGHHHHSSTPSPSAPQTGVYGNHVWVEVKQVGDIPPTSCNFALAVARDSIYLFSGHSGARITNKLFQFVFSTTTWTRINTEHILRGGLPAPEKRYGHTMVAFNRHLYVFGGATGGTVLANELHCYDLDTQTWSTVERSEDTEFPSGRLFHSATLVGNQLYIIGGTMDNSKRSREVFRIGLTDCPPCTLKEDFRRLLHRQNFVDLVMEVASDGGGGGKERVVGHTAIVAARSGFLRDVILEAKRNSSMTSTRGGDSTSHATKDCLCQQCSSGALPSNQSSASVCYLVNLGDDVELGPFRLIMDYIYTDRICPTEGPFTTDVVILMIKVYKLSIKFQLKRLETLFGPYFESIMSASNVLIALQMSWKMGLSSLVGSCLRFIMKEANYETIVMSDEFGGLEKPLILEVVRRKKKPGACFSIGNPPGTWQSDANEILSDPHSGGSLEEDMEAFMQSEAGIELSDVSLVFSHSPSSPISMPNQSSIPPASVNAVGLPSIHPQSQRPIPAHKAILAARSTYLEAMLRSLVGERMIRVQVSPGQRVAPPASALNSLLRYIYLGDVKMPVQDSLYLFAAPYYFGFTNTRLQLACKQNLEVNISVENVLEILEAAERVQATEMKQHALSIIVANPHKVANSPSLHQLSQSLLVEVIQALAAALPKSNSLNINIR